MFDVTDDGVALPAVGVSGFADAIRSDLVAFLEMGD